MARTTVELSEAHFLKVCAVNQTSVFFLGMQAVIPSMLRLGGGSIVSISSLAGVVAVSAHASRDAAP
jgi:3alpha(or 20beta)-hydroxysteroid dehydrogenase